MEPVPDTHSPDPETHWPLARYQGDRPAAPRWFEHAIAQRPERSFVEVEGASIELLVWGERGKPGLLFIHGGRAHADWWSFIAPLFADAYRVAALSLSGMGRSGWREGYSVELFGREVIAAAEAAGLFETQQPPVVVGHSFGGWINMYVASEYGRRLKGAIILDSGLLSFRSAPDDLPLHPRPNRVYPTLAAALARFRLLPEQVCDNHYILDYIARESLKPAPLPVEGSSAHAPGGGTGWTWRFDPRLGASMSGDFFEKVERAFLAPTCPLAMVWGDRSLIVSGALLTNTLSRIPETSPRVVVPDAAHHLFLDQPLAVVAGLRGLLSTWPAA